MFEGVFEGDVAKGVAGWIDCAVDVAEPVAEGPHGVWNAAGAKRVNEHHHIVGSPSSHKRHQNSHDGPCDFLLTGRYTSPLSLFGWLESRF